MKPRALQQSLHELADQWPEMGPIQRSGFIGATALTLSAGVRPFIELRQGRNVRPSRRQLQANIALDFRDLFDGRVARATDAVTSFGKLIDPIADKLDFLIQEIFHHQRGNLALHHLILRSTRDVAVTGLRIYAKKISQGEIDISAGTVGKASTLMREVSLRTTGTMLESYLPRPLHQTLATGALLGSGGQNAVSLRKKIKAYKGKST